jgi:hypothetical protein
MPIVTTLGQRCTVFLNEDGVQRFKIESSIDAVLAGDLPIYGPSPYTSHVFVHKVVVPTDPKSDTFLRVANVADLTTLALGRELALGLGQPLYLSTEFTVVYEDIATASSAKVLIQQRVDNLIADWHAYNEKFLAPLNAPQSGPPYTYSDIDLPLNQSLEDERQAAYDAAHSAYLESKLAALEATSDASISAAAATAANDDAVSAVAESQQCSNMLGQFNGANTGVGSYRSSVNAFLAASATYATATATFVAAADTYRAIAGDPNVTQEGVYDAAKAAYVNAKSIYDAAVAAMNVAVVLETTNGQAALETFRNSMATACTQKIADVSIASQKKKEADTAAAEAATAKRAADEAQSAALLADTVAFLSLQEICPEAERTVP